MNHDDQQAGGETVPRYRLLEPAYFTDFASATLRDALGEIRTVVDGKISGDALLSKGDEVATIARPGPHMEPLNDAARAMCALHPEAMVKIDLLDQLRLIGGEAGELLARPGATPGAAKAAAPARKRRAKKRRTKAARRATKTGPAIAPLLPTTPTEGSA